MIISLMPNCQQKAVFMLRKKYLCKIYPLLKVAEKVSFSTFSGVFVRTLPSHLKIMLVKLYKFVLTSQSQAGRSDKFVLIFFEVYPYD